MSFVRIAEDFSADEAIKDDNSGAIRVFYQQSQTEKDGRSDLLNKP